METCSIDGCARKRKYKETGWCQTHYHRWWRTGHPLGLKQERGASGPDCVNWRGDDISYRAAHCRVTNAKGRAVEHDCVMCGQQASHWAYDGSDPNQKWEQFSNWPHPIPYSTDVTRYHSLCRGCHLKVDRYGYSLTPTEIGI